MLVVVLIPLIVMVLACLLERLEARAVPADSARSAPRASHAPAALPPAGGGRHLTLVPDTGTDAGPGPGPDAAFDPATLRLNLRKAS